MLLIGLKDCDDMICLGLSAADAAAAAAATSCGGFGAIVIGAAVATGRGGFGACVVDYGARRIPCLTNSVRWRTETDIGVVCRVGHVEETDHRWSIAGVDASEHPQLGIGLRTHETRCLIGLYAAFTNGVTSAVITKYITTMIANVSGSISCTKHQILVVISHSALCELMLSSRLKHAQ